MVVGDGEWGYVFRGECGAVVIVVAVRTETKDDRSFCGVMKVKTGEKNGEERSERRRRS